MKKRPDKIFNVSLFLGAIIALSIWVFAISLISADSKNDPGVVFVDVGQGDSALINLPDSVQILVDTGKGSDLPQKIERYMPSFDRKLEYLVLTHADSDHIGATDEIIESFQVGQIIVGPSKSDSKVYQTIEEMIVSENISKKQVSSGDVICPFEYSCMTFLSPSEDFASSSTNEQSLVFRFNYNDFKIMFTGDAEKNVQKQIADKYEANALSSDVLKVAHHGSKDATDESFLEEVRPSRATISVGKNSYGHPSQDVIDFLKGKSIEVLRTDEVGDIRMSFSK